ncbi:MAG: hypothetical protein CMB79_19665 [Filomicrobium sp.]|nr:hypothetical protein [Filomicrobium sp.]
MLTHNQVGAIETHSIRKSWPTTSFTLSAQQRLPISLFRNELYQQAMPFGIYNDPSLEKT